MTLEEAKEKILVGRKYKHYKGGIYEVDSFAINVATNSPMVIYRKVETGEYFARPADNWFETITVPRFKLIEEV